MTATRTSRSAGRSFLLEPLRRPERFAVAFAALVAAAAHVPVIAPHLDEAPYMGVLFVVLTVACAVLGAVVLVRDTGAVYTAAAVTCALAVIGYAATRLVAFPMQSDDVGNWLEPLGIVSITSETLVVLAAISALRRRRTAHPLLSTRSRGLRPT
jgi:Na+-transporting NADH:ubiquinone oxidoreductase subunit NqrE